MADDRSNWVQFPAPKAKPVQADRDSVAPQPTKAAKPVQASAAPPAPPSPTEKPPEAAPAVTSKPTETPVGIELVGFLFVGNQAISSADYHSANVSNNNPLTVAGLGLSSIAGSNGSVPSNYQLSSSTASVSAAITPKPVVASDVVDPANLRLATSTNQAAAGAVSFRASPNSVAATEANAEVTTTNNTPTSVSSAPTPVMPGNKPSLAQQAMQGVTPRTMSQWSDAQVQSLPATQVAALEALQLKQVMRLLDADSQIRAINPLVLPKMDLQTLAGLSNKQINALTPEQLINMTKAQINFLLPVLSPSQINALRNPSTPMSFAK